jgi:vacuole morphology and inheritance protein 14
MSKLNLILQPILSLLSHEDEDIRKNANLTNDLLYLIMEKVKHTSIEFMNILPTVKQMYNEKKTSTAQNALKWMHILFKTYSDQMLDSIDDLLSNVAYSL